jgi:hypothetical protein
VELLLSVLAGIVKTQLAALVQGLVPMVCVVAESPPPERVMVPVGVAPVPLTETVTLRLAFELRVCDAGVTVMVGVSSTTVVTVTCPVLLVAA